MTILLASHPRSCKNPEWKGIMYKNECINVIPGKCLSGRRNEAEHSRFLPSLHQFYRRVPMVAGTFRSHKYWKQSRTVEYRPLVLERKYSSPWRHPPRGTQRLVNITTCCAGIGSYSVKDVTTTESLWQNTGRLVIRVKSFNNIFKRANSTSLQNCTIMAETTTIPHLECWTLYLRMMIINNQNSSHSYCSSWWFWLYRAPSFS